MTLYRYEFSKNGNSIGFLTGLDDYFTEDEIFKVCGIFEVSLNCPDINMDNTKSWFTEKGNRKFKKMIRKIQKIAEEKDIEFVCRKTEKETVKDLILYEDTYQVIILN